MTRNLTFLGIALLIALPASATTYTSLVGDKDGFGIPGMPAVPPDGTEIWLNGPTQSAGDPLFMDLWGYEQNDGSAFASPIVYSHDFAALDGPVLNASFVIQQAGMGNGHGPWDVSINGTSVGLIGDNNPGETSLVHTFAVPIPPALLGTSNAIVLTYLDSANEGFAINFSELTVETGVAAVPEPATLTLGIMGIASVGGYLRKRLRRSR